MSFNWNSSLGTTDDLLTSLLSETSPVDNTQQSFSQPSSTGPANDPTLDFTNPADFGFGPLLQDDFHFNDAYSDNNYYLLNNLEAMVPLGGAPGIASGSDSSPETISALDLNVLSVNQNARSRSSAAMMSGVESNVSPAEGSLPLPDSRSPSTSDVQSVPTVPDTRVENFLSNLTFLKSPMPTSTASGSALDTVAEETDLTSETLKRQRGAAPDVLTACWTSPLCPNNQKEGTPPDPANCGGACAPFLFDDQPLTDAIDTSLLPQEIETMEPIEYKPRPNLKRSESESSGAPIGRTFQTNKSTSTKSGTESTSEKMSSPEAPVPEANDESKPSKGRTRLPHNQVERKYRESLNTQLESLRRVVPALQYSRAPPCDGADIEDLPVPSKPSKALVLATATAYIKQIEKEKNQLVDENAALRSKVKALQSLVK